MAIPISRADVIPKLISSDQTRLELNSHWNSIFTVKSSIRSGAKQSARLLLSNFQFYKRKNSTLPRSMAADASCTTDGILKLATFVTKANKSQVGVVRDGSIWPLEQVVNLLANIDASHINDMIDVINHWDFLYSSMKLEGPGIPLEDVKLLAPITRPSGAIICIGKNYADHVKEIDTWKTAPGIASPNIPKYPIVFTKAPQSVIGPGAAIRYPHLITTQVDYETELAVIIGKSGHGIKREDAMSHVFGYTILNDVTARDLQKQHQQWFIGKSCDTFCPLGPWIVPATEINGQDLQIQCWINGELRQDARTSEMIFSIPQLIETISSGITLQPGDIIATGTPSGVGSGFDPPRHLVPGDFVLMKIEGIGELHNHVV
jgi:2-keto-4-pentenoate hydratase/2-oxohepta-3-ene-1,7-dioic acid hydratase in catechol pathway